jgi:hypothetical protein
MCVPASCGPQSQLFAPGTPQHPQCNGNDQGGRCDLQIWFRKGAVVLAAEAHTDYGRNPDHGRMRDRRREPQEHRSPYGAADGDNEGRHHGFAVPRL